MSNDNSGEGRRKRRGGLRVPSDNVPRRVASEPGDAVVAPIPEPVGLAASISESFGVAPKILSAETIPGISAQAVRSALDAERKKAEEDAAEVAARQPIELDQDELPTVVSEESVDIGSMTLPMEPITMEEEPEPLSSVIVDESATGFSDEIETEPKADKLISPAEIEPPATGESIDIPFDEGDETNILSEIPQAIEEVETPEPPGEEPGMLDTVVEAPAVSDSATIKMPVAAMLANAESPKKKPRFARALTMALNESDLEEVRNVEGNAAPNVEVSLEESGDVLAEEELEEVAETSDATAEASSTEPPPPPPPKAAPAKTPAKRPAEEKKRRRGKPWFEEVFDENYLRTLPFLTPQATQFEANFVMESLGLDAGAQILDVGCGYGRHAMELAARGYHMVGLDNSLPLLLRGADEAQRRGLTINFVHGDMREMTFESQFDGAYCLFSSFGYFDDETNKKTAQNIAKALKPGARFVVEVLNRDYLVADLPSRVWWEGDGCVVLEEVEFNYFSSRIVSNRSVVFDDGRQLEHEISLRSFSLHELGKFLHSVGFRVLEISGSMSTRGRFFGAHSRDIIVVAERRPD